MCEYFVVPLAFQVVGGFQRLAESNFWPARSPVPTPLLTGHEPVGESPNCRLPQFPHLEGRGFHRPRLFNDRMVHGKRAAHTPYSLRFHQTEISKRALSFPDRQGKDAPRSTKAPLYTQQIMKSSKGHLVAGVSSLAACRNATCDDLLATQSGQIRDLYCDMSSSANPSLPCPRHLHPGSRSCSCSVRSPHNRAAAGSVALCGLCLRTLGAVLSTCWLVSEHPSCVPSSGLSAFWSVVSSELSSLTHCV